MFRFVASLTCLLLITGCAPQKVARNDGRTVAVQSTTESFVDIDGSPLKYNTRVEVVSGFYEGLRGEVWKNRGRGTVDVTIDTIGHVSEGRWIEAIFTFNTNQLRVIPPNKGSQEPESHSLEEALSLPAPELNADGEMVEPSPEVEPDAIAEYLFKNRNAIVNAVKEQQRGEE